MHIYITQFYTKLHMLIYTVKISNQSILDPDAK